MNYHYPKHMLDQANLTYYLPTIKEMKGTCGNLQFILCRLRNDEKREAIALRKTYILQLKAREALASLFFSSSVLETLPVVGLLSI